MVTSVSPRVICLLSGALALGGCDNVGASTDKAGPARTKVDKPPIPVAVAKATRGAISSFYGTTATLEADRMAPILARVDGVVQSINAEEGDAVKAGQTLLRIENDEYKLRLQQATARRASLADQHARLKGMVANELVAREEFETIGHDLRSAEAEEELARLELSRTAVRAPFAGRVTRRLVDVGQTVKDQVSLFEVADLEPLVAQVHVPSKEFKRLAKNQAVKLRLDSNGAQLQGRIQLVSPVIDPASGTIKITVEVPEYPEDTRPGDFVQVSIVTERHEDAVLVPRTAVVEDRTERVVFVVEGDKAARRLVTVGFEEGDQVEILTGLDAGATVVVKGQHSLEDGAAIKVLEK